MAISEKTEHIKICEWLRHNQILFLHVPNEGKRSVQEAMMLQRMGLSKGAPDFLIFDHPEGYTGAAIELKIKGGRRSPEQVQWINDLRDRGWAANFCYGYQEAIDFLEGLGFGGRPIVEVMNL